MGEPPVLRPHPERGWAAGRAGSWAQVWLECPVGVGVLGQLKKKKR